MAALAGGVPALEGGEDRHGAVDAGEHVREGDRGLDRLALGLAGERHDPAEALDHEVVAGARRVGAVLAEAGDRAGDEPRVEGAQGLVVEPVLLQAPDLEVLDHHSAWAASLRTTA